jgi:hypothetical protein
LRNEREMEEMGDIGYDEWRDEMESLPLHPITKKINRENFGRFLELHRAIGSRDKTKVRRLSRELGLYHINIGRVS